MNSQTVAFTSELDDEPLTVGEKYKWLAQCSLQRSTQAAGRFRAIRILLDDAIHRQVNTPRDRERIKTILALTLEKVQDFEDQANEFVDPSNFILLDANGWEVPQTVLAESLKLMSVSHAPRQRAEPETNLFATLFDSGDNETARQSRTCVHCPKKATPKASR